MYFPINKDLLAEMENNNQENVSSLVCKPLKRMILLYLQRVWVLTRSQPRCPTMFHFLATLVICYMLGRTSGIQLVAICRLAARCH